MLTSFSFGPVGLHFTFTSRQAAIANDFSISLKAMTGFRCSLLYCTRCVYRHINSLTLANVHSDPDPHPDPVRVLKLTQIFTNLST